MRGELILALSIVSLFDTEHWEGKIMTECSPPINPPLIYLAGMSHTSLAPQYRRTCQCGCFGVCELFLLRSDGYAPFNSKLLVLLTTNLTKPQEWVHLWKSKRPTRCCGPSE